MACGVKVMARVYFALLTLLAIACGVSLTAHPPRPNSNGQSEAPRCKATTHFECNDYFRICIPIGYVCDGQWDCAEGEDEVNCSEDMDHDLVPSDVEFDEEGFLICSANDDFRCEADGKCIKKGLMCNGRKDCSDGSDEGAWCDGCQDVGCSHQCENTLDGPRCHCPAGMKLSADEKTCEFENRCARDSNCSHDCIDSIDRLVCVCADGYDLQSDGFTCAANATYQHGRLFFSKDGHSVQVAELFPAKGKAFRFPPADPLTADAVEDLPTVKLLPTQRITAIAFANGIDRLYYVVNSAPRLSEVMAINANDPNATSRTLLLGHGIKHIAFDWVVGNVYYAADGIGIGVCSKCGEYCRHLIAVPRNEEGALAHHYVGLIVHPRRGLLFWSEISADYPTGIVMVTALDGSKQRAFGHVPAMKLVSISIDYVRDELYILEADGLLSAYDLHTMQRYLRDSGGVSGRVGTMIHFDGHRYFHSLDSIVKQAMAKPSELHDISPIQANRDPSLAIDNELYYNHADLKNPCCAKKCSHMCVLKEGGVEAECLCPNKYVFDELSGICSFNKSHSDGPVRLSPSRLKDICQSRGLIVDEWDGEEATGCLCQQEGHSGLYCELQQSAEAITGSGSSMALIAVGILLGVLGAGAGAATGHLLWKKCCGLKRRPNGIGMGEFNLGYGRQALIGRADSCTYDIRSTYSNGQNPTRVPQSPIGLLPAPRTTSLGVGKHFQNSVQQIGGGNVVGVQLKEEIRKAYESECAKNN